MSRLGELLKLEGQFHKASDYAWKEFHVTLQLEAWAASIGLKKADCEALRRHLELSGVL